MSTRSWTATWAIVLAHDADTATLTGTATITNDTAEDWNGVALQLLPRLPQKNDPQPDAEPDRDHDRIADDIDACPDEAETYNGVEDEDGCPDRGRCCVESQCLQIAYTVPFERGSRLTRVATKALRDLAGVLVANERLEQLDVITVIGAITSGERAELANERARAVIDAFVTFGIARARFVVGPAAAGSSMVRFEASCIPTTPPPMLAPETPSAEAQRKVYLLPDRISLRRGKSISIALGPETIAAERIAYRAVAPPGAKVTLRRARRLSSLHGRIDLGRVTISGDASSPPRSIVIPYLGELRSTYVKLDAQPELEVEVQTESYNEPVHFVSLRAGRAVVEDRAMHTTRVLVKAGAHVPRRVFVGLPRFAGREPTELPLHRESAPDGYLVPLVIEPGASRNYVLVEESPMIRRARHLFEMDPARIDRYLENDVWCPDAVSTALEAVKLQALQILMRSRLASTTDELLAAQRANLERLILAVPPFERP